MAIVASYKVIQGSIWLLHIYAGALSYANLVWELGLWKTHTSYTLTMYVVLGKM